jgi:hypothetical protein
MSGKNSSNYCKDLSVASRKALAYYIYHKKQGLNPSWSIYQPDVCTSEKLYAKTHLFFKWFKFISEEFHKKVYIMENTPSKVASKAYVYRKLNKIQFVRNLNRRQFKSLQEKTLQSINSDKAFDPGKKLAKLTSQDVSIIQAFIKTVKERIKDGTFLPSKYTDPRGCRLFSLAPIYAVQNKAVQIDTQAFWKLIKEFNVPGYHTGKKTEAELTDFYYKLFKFSKLGFRTRDSLSTGKKRFS